MLNYSTGGEVPLARYYRAVYVLQKLDENACKEDEEIPVRVMYSDATEDLLHHPDRILVLKHIAGELAQVRKEKPKALFYEACARLALGDRTATVKLLSAYVIDNTYNAGHYALLCRTLYELGDNKSLLLICREWNERAPDCHEGRLRFTWTAQFNLERYADARLLMQEAENCLGWRAVVYDAKAALAESGEREAKQLLEQGVAKYPGSAMQIMRMWNILKPKRRV